MPFFNSARRAFIAKRSALLATVAQAVASITSLPTLTQSASVRYFRATADRPGTWGKGTGGNAADFTIDATTGIWSLNANALGDGTLIQSKSIPLVFTPSDGTGIVRQTVALTVNTLAPAASVSENYQSDFSGAAGTKLSSLPGWSISRTGTGTISEPVLTGDGRLTGTDGYNDKDGLWAVLYTPTSPLAGSEITFVVGPATLTYQSISFFACASDYANGIGIAVDPRPLSDGVNVAPHAFIKQGNTVTDAPTNLSRAGPYYNSAQEAVLTFKVNDDATAVTITVTGDVSTTTTVSLVGLTVGNKFGFTGQGPYVPAMQSVNFVKRVGFIKPGTALAVTAAPTYTIDNKVEYSLSWSGTKPTMLDHRFYNDTGTPVSPWITGDSKVTGTTSGIIAYTASTPVAGALFAHFRPHNDIGVVTIAPSPTYCIANVQEFQMGYNIRAANYYQPCTWDNNYGPSCHVQQDRIYMPYDSIEGFSNIQIGGGTTITGHSADIQIISDNGTGGLRLNISQSQSGDQTRYLSWSGNTPTSLTAVRDGRTTRTPTEWINGVQGRWLRDLDATAANNIPENTNLVRSTLASPFYGNDYGVGPDLPYQVRTDAIAAKMAVDPNFVGFWTVLGVDLALEGTGGIREIATYWRDTLPPRAKIAPEFGNETWNQQFTSYNRLQLDGVKYGYYGNATENSPSLPLNIVYGGGGPPGTVPSGDQASLKTTMFVAAGNYLFANIYGRGNRVYRAKQDCPIGTYVADGTVGNTTDNAYFAMENINAGQAGQRWEAVRYKQILGVIREVFGNVRYEAQIVPILMGQAGGSIYDQFVEKRTFVSNLGIKGTGHAFYFGPANDLNPTTVTAAEIEASIRANLDTYKAYTRSAVLDSLRMGTVPMFYEGMTHPDFRYYNSNPEGPYYNYYVQWNLLFSSDAGRSIMSDMAYFMKSTVPGVCIGYDLVGAKPWSLMNNWRDTSNKRLIGWNEGLAR